MSLRILALGDSLTAGFGLMAGQSYPSLVEAMLLDQGFDVSLINEGISGDTSFGAKMRLSYALARSPDLAVVELGLNDWFMGFEPSVTESALDAILRELARREIRTILAGMTAPPEMSFTPYSPQDFDALYSRLAQKHGVTLFPDFLQGVVGEPSLTLDGVHPNTQGTQRIAERIFPYVKQAVQTILAN